MIVKCPHFLGYFLFSVVVLTLATETIFQVYEVLLMWTLNILESPCSLQPPESGLVSF